METVVKLKHATSMLPERWEHFYDGFVIARNGVVEVPSYRDVWLKQLYYRGYRCTLDGRYLHDMFAMLAERDRQVAQSNQPIMSTESAEVAIKKYEDIDSWGQPSPKDRVRVGKRSSSKRVPA